jgi:hypothetical protein
MAVGGLATAAWILYNIRKRSAARAISSDLAGRPLLDFHRTLLERERDFYGKPLWFFLPVSVSQIVIFASFLTNARVPHSGPAVMLPLSFLGSAVAVLAVGRKNGNALRAPSKRRSKAWTPRR